MSDDEVRQAREIALAALARREHARQELARKLGAREFDASVIGTVLDALVEAGLQDDRRFAEAYVRYRSERGYGPRRIVQELRQRGVADTLSGSVVAAAEIDWFERASDVRTKKFRSAPDSYQERARQNRFMEYRGFDSEQIRYAFGHTTDDENR